MVSIRCVAGLIVSRVCASAACNWCRNLLISCCFCWVQTLALSHPIPNAGFGGRRYLSGRNGWRFLFWRLQICLRHRCWIPQRRSGRDHGHAWRRDLRCPHRTKWYAALGRGGFLRRVWLYRCGRSRLESLACTLSPLFSHLKDHLVSVTGWEPTRMARMSMRSGSTPNSLNRPVRVTNTRPVTR